MSLEDVVKAINAGNKSAAEDAFKVEINQRASQAIDARRVDIAQQMYKKPSEESAE